MGVVAVATINDLMCKDVFNLLNEVGLHGQWWLLWAMSSWVVIVHMVHLEEGDVKNWIYW